MNDTRAACAVAVFAKAPQSGRSKTRLAPAIGADEAASLGAAFLRDTTDNVRAAGRCVPIKSYVAYAPLGSAALLEPHLAAGTTLIFADGAGSMPVGVDGLGRCVFQAFKLLFEAGHPAVCVMNADGPNLPTRYLVQAARMLAAPGDRAVLGSTSDGGYYLLGLKRAHAALFRDVAWSTDTVAATTCARAAEIGLELAHLPEWFDVDDGPSLKRLVASLSKPAVGDFAAPATRAALQRLSLIPV